MTKYVMIIEGCWCGYTHIEGIYKNFFDAIIAARDWLAEQLNDESPEYQKAIIEFVENDFLYVEGMFVIDEFKEGE